MPPFDVEEFIKTHTQNETRAVAEYLVKSLVPTYDDALEFIRTTDSMTQLVILRETISDKLRDAGILYETA